MNKTVIFRMTSSSSFQLSGLKAGDKVARVKFTRSRKVANGTRNLYGMFRTDDVAIIKAMITHNAFKDGYYVISAHENDAKYIKKVFGLEIEDIGVSQSAKISEMKAVEQLAELQVKYNLVVAERDDLLLKLKEYDVQGAPTPVVKVPEIVPEKEVVEEGPLVPIKEEEAPEVVETNKEETPTVITEDGISAIPRGDGISDEDFKQACATLKGYNFETQKHPNQLKAIAKFFGIEASGVVEYIDKLTKVKELL